MVKLQADEAKASSSKSSKTSNKKTSFRATFLNIVSLAQTAHLLPKGPKFKYNKVEYDKAEVLKALDDYEDTDDFVTLGDNVVIPPRPDVSDLAATAGYPQRGRLGGLSFQGNKQMEQLQELNAMAGLFNEFVGTMATVQHHIREIESADPESAKFISSHKKRLMHKFDVIMKKKPRTDAEEGDDDEVEQVAV